ncbi:5-methylcytosine restriction system specificity protein McrC [Chitinimonas lacunae]|uniref:5-methylcytosine-specific restriction endonuclease system specificity protein McrC n=1 Tax=Chitinimonas lacunae TaxID=1963018 RepID=A0ABV8MU17_9NEIS
MDAPAIPVRNLYYLLCYAWDCLEPGELIDVSRLPYTELVDLLALALCEGVRHMARRGLDQGYQAHEAVLAGVRGRVDLLASARRFLPQHGQALCRFDELTVNTLPNQIIKTTLNRLSQEGTLDPHLRRQVERLQRDLPGIATMALSRQSFQRVQLAAHNRFYRFLLHICEALHGAWLIDSETGQYRFRDFRRDDRQMAKLFERFLFHFLRIELLDWQVKRQGILWKAESDSDPHLSLLPAMQTDISLRRGGQLAIIDAKFYRQTLSRHFDTPKIHHDNLYQLMSYLHNAPRQDGDRLTGMLIYPRVDQSLRQRYLIQGYPVAVATVDLDQPWQAIKQELLEMMQWGLGNPA